MNNTLISVIMPAWNAGLTVTESVQSVLQQSHKNLELIVVDDGSDDDTCDRLRMIDDDRLSVHQVLHRGVSAARNHGIGLGSGEYVAFIDADDLWLERKLEAQLNALLANPKASVVYGFLDRIDHHGNHRSPHSRAIHNGSVLETLLVWNFVGNGSNLMVSRNAIDRVGGFNESLDSAEDWEFSVRLARKYSFVCVPEVVGLYRQSRQSASRQLKKMERGYRKAIRLIYQSPTSSERLLRRQGLAVHYHYLSCKAFENNHSVRDAIACIRFIVKCVFLSVTAGGIHRDLGIFPHFLKSCIRLLRPSKEPEKWSPGDEFKHTGMIRKARPLSDPSVLPALISDKKVFAEAIASLRESGHQYRVPYIITDAIRKVAFDKNITDLVYQVFGDNTPWVMWGANIRVNVPNDANFWHTDTESSNWESITVVVGLDGCEGGNASKYIPYSHLTDKEPPGSLEYSDRDEILLSAQRLSPVCQRIESFSNFGNGCFYAFNAKGWHCGDPVTSEGRLLLFMHYQRAADKRVPYMDNYVKDIWFDEAASYISSFDKDGSEKMLPGTVNRKVHRPPTRSKRKRNLFTAGLRKLLRRRSVKPD